MNLYQIHLSTEWCVLARGTAVNSTDKTTVLCLCSTGEPFIKEINKEVNIVIIE